MKIEMYMIMIILKVKTKNTFRNIILHKGTIHSGLPFKTVKHVVTTVDVQPIPGQEAYIILVLGQLKVRRGYRGNGEGRNIGRG